MCNCITPGCAVGLADCIPRRRALRDEMRNKINVIIRKRGRREHAQERQEAPMSTFRYRQEGREPPGPKGAPGTAAGVLRGPSGLRAK